MPEHSSSSRRQQLQPIHPDELEGCTDCITEAPERYRTIHVRKLDDPTENDLFDQ